jgi:hypothetical protein
VHDVDGLYRELLESSCVVLPPAAQREAEGVAEDPVSRLHRDRNRVARRP